MKAYKFFAALVLGLTVAACGNEAAQPAVDGEEAVPQEMTAKDFIPSKAEVNTVSYLLGVNFGSVIKANGFGDIDYSVMLKGLKDFIAAEGNPRDPDFGAQFKVDPNTMNDVFNTYLEKRHNYNAYENKAKSEAFLAANAKKEGVQVSESGLQYKIIEAGNDVKAGPADQVSVNYKGTLIDGTVFDETPEGSDPITLSLAQVIPGWTEGLQLVGEGGHIMLYIPSDLAYGEHGGGQVIGPNAAIVFDVKLVKVIKAETEE